MPDTCACVRQPRSELRDATKSSICCTSCPDKNIVVMVLSKGKTLYISSRLSGPDSKSARMPSELVSAKSASTRLRSRIAEATRLPSCESPPLGSLRVVLGQLPPAVDGHGTTAYTWFKLRNEFILS